MKNSGSRGRSALCALISVISMVSAVAAAGAGQAVQDRIDADVANNLPVVVHVVVALCDNENQGIVPVSKSLGNGQDPKSNLYWGALYGVRTHFGRAGWERLDSVPPQDNRILDRAIFYADVKRVTSTVPVYVIADAWDGAQIRNALQTYLEMAAGRQATSISVRRENDAFDLSAGGASHLVVYVGHNGLMDFRLDKPAPPSSETPARSTVVLACDSKSYFTHHLETAQAHPLLLTTGLMAPEAYTLNSAIRSWVSKGASSAVVQAAAKAYDKYQKCGLRAAQRLFWGAD